MTHNAPDLTAVCTRIATYWTRIKPSTQIKILTALQKASDILEDEARSLGLRDSVNKMNTRLLGKSPGASGGGQQ